MKIFKPGNMVRLFLKYIRQYKQYNFNGVNTSSKTLLPLLPLTFDDTTLGMLYGLYDTYNKFSAMELSQKTHFEQPYIDAYKKGVNTIISKDSITVYFKEKVYNKWLDGTLFTDLNNLFY